MYLLFPGRHHLLTNFQHNYLLKIVKDGLHGQIDYNGEELTTTKRIQEIIFPVTSANHFNTRRNPVPFYQRAMAIQEFSHDFPILVSVYDIDDIGETDDFANYVLKKISARSNGRLKLTPENTVVACSTPVLKMYQKMGFKILPVELGDKEFRRYKTLLPWEIVEEVAVSDQWIKNINFLQKTHPASQKIWLTYEIGNQVKKLFNDPIIGDDGDLTDTRDYNTYVRSMDNTAERKYDEIAAYIKAGRIGDIGCAAGALIKRASEDPRLRESDFYGVEVARKLYDICEQRKSNGDFESDYVFFSKKNAVTEAVFEPNSMDTILTSSLTHEIESYVGGLNLKNSSGIASRSSERAADGSTAMLSSPKMATV